MTAYIAFFSSSVIDGTVYMTSHSLVELGLPCSEARHDPIKRGMMFWEKVHAETKGEVEALDELILEIMPLNHTESGQWFFANFEHKFCADGLATDKGVE